MLSTNLIVWKVTTYNEMNQKYLEIFHKRFTSYILTKYARDRLHKYIRIDFLLKKTIEQYINNILTKSNHCLSSIYFVNVA